jgi:crossover junction endodeoxyribonuclease RusA
MATWSVRLPFPPSVNSAWRHATNKYTGKPTTYLTKPQREFREQVSQAASGAPCVFTGRLAVAIELVAPTKRKYDIDGRIKAVLDALQHATVFVDDEQVDRLDVRRLHVEPPGACDVTITELNGQAWEGER